MNTIKWQSLLLFDAILLSRYAMVIWLKNPAAVKDDFWSAFISQWTFCVSFLVNFVLFFFAKRLPQIYYTCSNSDPASDYQNSHSEGYIEIFSITLYIVTKVRLSVYSHYQNPLSQSLNIFSKTFLLYTLEKQCLVDLTSLIINKLSFALLALLSAKVNKLSLSEVNSYPNYLYVYSFQLLGPPMICLIIIGVQYIRHRTIIKVTSNQCKDAISCIE